MGARQPTAAEIKEFWEWCGLRYETWGSPSFPNYGGAWHDQENQFVDLDNPGNLPSVDLNNLFKYAVPKVIATDGYSLELIYFVSHREAHIRPHYLGDKHYSASSKDPALALFWAIMEVIHGS